MIEALDIQVKGIVQGVGFRPFVYRMAKKYLINGWVFNAVDGVHIHAEGEGNLLGEFVLELSDNAPAAAKVQEIDLHEVPLQDFSTFEIRYSDEGEVEETTLASPDLATCPDCARELFDPADRRYRYPFINCTNCGPRFTIIEKLPYDRKSTSMKEFPLCPQCAHEYADPADRRFHAQPNACFECGPKVSFAVRAEEGEGCAAAHMDDSSGLVVSWGTTREESDAIFTRAAKMLCEGKILAVKGLGGFHLVCDATNAQAVATLRERKHREGKAFAVMMANADDVRAVCEVNAAEQAILEGAQRPIVLLRKRAGVRLAPKLADNLPELGVMLPYTPVQHLLLHDFAEAKREMGKACGGAGSTPRDAGDAPCDAGAGEDVPCGAGDVASCDAGDATLVLPPMLVMTSGNLHDEPIVIDDAEAYGKLAGVADAFLGNNRAIRSRYDDSVVRVIRAGSAGDAVQFIRRARGYAPVPLAFRQIEEGQPAILAVGSEQKNTFTLARGAEAFVSQHVGDLENAETYDAWLDAKRRYETLFDVAPERLACDFHPEYLSTKWAVEQAEKAEQAEKTKETEGVEKAGLPLERVQHHHAHVVSAMAENGLEEPVCGIAFDGTGYGADGNIWGGEVLLANLEAFERFANFAYVPMPGGAAAVKHPLRMAYGVLWAFDLLDHPGAADALAKLGQQAALCDQMIEQGINTPMTSSVGRLFDAASALLGICTEPLYEGEPAILLEAAIDSAGESDSPAYSIDIMKNTATAESTAQDTSVVLFDAAPAFRALLDDKAANVPMPLIARRFHNAFVQVIVDAAQLVRGVYGISTVALSGGVFMNRYLMEHALAALEEAGFTVAVNRDLPPNDGCISFGQAVVAWNRAAKAVQS